jgi:hypothetical protein
MSLIAGFFRHRFNPDRCAAVAFPQPALGNEMLADQYWDGRRKCYGEKIADLEGEEARSRHFRTRQYRSHRQADMAETRSEYFSPVGRCPNRPDLPGLTLAAHGSNGSGRKGD